MTQIANVRQQFENRLSTDWHALANQLDIPEPDRAKWKQGYEAAGIWVWLQNRRRLTELPQALRQVERDDLAQEFDHLTPEDYEASIGGGEPAPPPVWIDWLRNWKLAVPLVIFAVIGVAVWSTINPPPGPPEDLPGKLFELSNLSPLRQEYTAHSSTGLVTLIESAETFTSNGWYGFVFATNPLPKNYNRPTASIEIRDAAGNLIRNVTDIVELHWLAPTKDLELEERAVGSLRIDQAEIIDQYPKTVAAGTILVVVYRYRELRDHLPEITVKIRE